MYVSNTKYELECEITVLNSGLLKRKVLVKSNLRGYGSQHESANLTFTLHTDSDTVKGYLKTLVQAHCSYFCELSRTFDLHLLNVVTNCYVSLNLLTHLHSLARCQVFRFMLATIRCLGRNNR